MPRSLAGGDYRLLMAVESSSRPGAWYRICADRRDHSLSCDCPRWTFNGNGNRSCSHTELARLLTSQPATPRPQPGLLARLWNNLLGIRAISTDAVIAATQTQWPGLQGAWSMEQAGTRIGTKDYRIVLLRLVTPDGGEATGVVAFAEAHRPDERSMLPALAGWAGYAIAAEVARRAGYATAGQPPEHFRVQRSTGRRATLGLGDILRVGDQVNLGDGLTPEQRANNTLRLFLGDLYPQIERNGFIDVPSTHYAADERVYRIRRDPSGRRDRRVRVFEHGRYVRDFCIVRAQNCPPDDHILTVFLRLLSDEMGVLSVVKRYNIFPCYSDGSERETIPAVWTERPVAA